MQFRCAFLNAQQGYHIIAIMKDESYIPSTLSEAFSADNSSCEKPGVTCVPLGQDVQVVDAHSEDRRRIVDEDTRGAHNEDTSEMTDEDYMRLALEEARRAGQLDEVPIGAIVVYEPIDPATRRPLAKPRVIARACNLRETTRDPAGHAEFLAMKQAAEVLDAWRLTGCTVYVTLEPCIMCAGLMHQSRIDRCVYGAFDSKAGALGTLYSVNADERLNHNFEVTSGVLEEECAAELRTFFANKRKKR